MSPVTNITAAANSSSACDAWITAPPTKSCGVGVCSNATGVPTCICSPGWSGIGDYDFRSLPLQDADCDKYPDFFRACHLLAATVSFVNMFCGMYMYKMARSKKGRKKTTAMLLTIVTMYACVLWGFRGIDPKRSIGVDPAITVLFAGYTLLWWSAATYVYWSVVQIATSATKFDGGSSPKSPRRRASLNDMISDASSSHQAVAFSVKALRIQVPLIVIAAIAPLFCLLEDMTIKHVFATVHFVAVGFVIGSFGVVNIISFGMVVEKTEEMTNKSVKTRGSFLGKVKQLKNMKTWKRHVTSQTIQNMILAVLFAFLPFLQVRASWNLSIAYPLVIHCLILPIVTKVFWPKKRRSKKVSPVSPESSVRSINRTAHSTVTAAERVGRMCSDGSTVRPPTQVSTTKQ
jgi:hypothetical protein